MIAVSGKKENIVVKRRKCCLPALSPFLTIFSKSFSCREVSTKDCLGKGLRLTLHYMKKLTTVTYTC